MLARIAAFELRRQLRQPIFWIVLGLFGVLGFAATAGGESLSLGGGGRVHANAPMALATAHAAFNLVLVLGATAMVAEALVRDVRTGFGAILFAAPFRTVDHVYGRFLGAVAAVAIAYGGLSLGMVAGSIMPWNDPALLGPFRPRDYVYAYVVFGLPGLLLTSSVVFAVAAGIRSTPAVYLGAALAVILYLVADGVAGDRPELEAAAAWMDPFGVRAHALAVRDWTSDERNSLNPSLSGILLGNRLLWTGLSLAVLAGAPALFQRADGARRGRRAGVRSPAAPAAPDAWTGQATVRSGAGGGAAAVFGSRLLHRTGFEARFIFSSPAYGLLLLFGLALTAHELVFAGQVYGTPALPTTRLVIRALEGGFSLAAVIVVCFHAGELVWRDRGRRMHELVDATSAPDGVLVASKLLALALVLAATLLTAVAIGMTIQTARGYFDYEVGKYLWWYVWRQGTAIMLLAVLTFVVHALSPSRIVGWSLMLGYVLLNIIRRRLGFDHYLYSYGGGPRLSPSDMNGLGDIGGRLPATQAYWAAFAGLLVLAVLLLWPRGTDPRTRPRLAKGLGRLRGPAGLAGAGLLAAFVGLGAFIYLNTNVWNLDLTSAQRDLRAAQTEKTLLHFEDRSQPVVTDVVMTLDLEPKAPRLTARGRYEIENRTGAPLAEVHLRWSPDLTIRELESPGAQTEREWAGLGYRIMRFDRPMAPGEKRVIRFETVLEQRGFRNGGDITDIVDNGVFVSSIAFAPRIGMDRRDLLIDPAVRRRHGLAPELGMRRLDDVAGQRRNYVGADWVRADITVVTPSDQTAVAPGKVVSDTIRKGRRTMRFVPDAPILNLFPVQSARYAVVRGMHEGVALEIYHHPSHGRNVGRMMDVLRAGLDTYQSAFGPYPFRQVKIAEFPAYGRSAQAFGGVMPLPEGAGFLADLRDPARLDYASFTVAHELAHQWWAHQVMAADVEGATALTETLAEYSALLVIEGIHGPDAVRRLLRHELAAYLKGRDDDRTGEPPLLRVQPRQGYVHYNKGGHVLYLLRNEIGEAAVHRALRRMLAAHRFSGAPYPRATDLVAALRAEAPAGRQGLITDLFEKVTLYDLRIAAAQAAPLGGGGWEVTVTVEAEKVHVDAAGAETPAPLDEVMEIGLFRSRPGAGPLPSADVLAMERRPVRSGTQTYRFRTTSRPAFAAVDPHGRWIDRAPADNAAPVR